MRTRWLGIIAVLCSLVPVAALGVDAPHDGSATLGTCETCHQIHNATGGTLINAVDNNTACSNCHNTPAATINPARLGLPWISEDQAVPGNGGAQHRWDALAASPAFGAALPTDGEMLKRIKDGRIQCAACHDPHADVKAFDPTALHTSLAPGTATAVTGGTATMTMALTAPAAAATTKGYRVQVLRISGATFELGISHNAKTTDGPVNWLNHNGTSWVAGTSAGTGTKFWTTGAAVALDDGASVQVTFTGTAAVGQFWDFYISYAHLRASNVADAMCLQCHATRNQNHTYVEGPGDGVKVFSHPVNVALNVNGKGYDRANVLDANGLTQTVGDGNPTNDLTLVSGAVLCTTCHNVHNADSNSLTTDAR
jgi:predicted CXXCH cytochrome family protein